MTLLLGFIVLFVAWLAPAHFNPWVNFHNELCAAVGALLVGFGAVSAAGGSKAVVWTPLSLVVLAAAIVAALQTLFGQIRFISDGALAVAYLVGFAVAMSTGATLVQSPRRAEFLSGMFATLLAAGLVSVGIAAVQWLELTPMSFIEAIPRGGRPFANLVQPNHLASLLALALVGALWLYEERRIQGPVLALCALWLGLGIVMTRSRFPWLFFFVFAFGWWGLRRRAGLRLSGKAVALSMAAFFALALAWGPISQAVDVAAPLSVAERLQGGGGRLQIWKAVIEGLWASPWLGYGWTQASKAGLVGSLQHFTGEAMLRNSHSTPLDLLVWNGILIGLLFLGAAVWWFVRQVRGCRSAQQFVLLAAVSVVLTHALFEFPLEYLYFLLTVGLLMGALDHWTLDARVWRAPRLALALPLVALTATTAWVAVEYARVQLASSDNLIVLAGYGHTAELPDVVLLDAPREYIRFWKSTAKPAMTEAELAWMRDVVERNPAPPSLLRYALAMGINGRASDASDTLVRLCNMHRTARCDEGRASWAQLTAQYPVLGSIAYPRTPTGQ